jgi:membrane AbrB-like protein
MTERAEVRTLLDFIITLGIGGSVGYLFLKLKVPGGMMVGSIVAVSLLNIFTGHALMPAAGKLTAQIVAGAFIGVGVEKSDLLRLKKIYRPALVLIVTMLGLNLLSGYLIYLVSPLDLVTSLMSAVPGGMSDIPIISADMGADASKVAVMQFVRLVAGIGFFPGLIKLISSRHQADVSKPEVVFKRQTDRNNQTATFIKTIIVATLFGLLGKASGIPAGALLFSLVSVVVLKLTSSEAFMPRWVKRLAQVLSGAYIGSGIFYADVLEIRYLAIPALILITGYFLVCLFLGFVLHKNFDMSLKEAMLTATPAGASDMALIASDLGIQSTDVIVLQIVRMVIVVTVFPQVIQLVVHFSGG